MFDYNSQFNLLKRQAQDAGLIFNGKEFVEQPKEIWVLEINTVIAYLEGTIGDFEFLSQYCKVNAIEYYEVGRGGDNTLAIKEGFHNLIKRIYNYEVNTCKAIDRLFNRGIIVSYKDSTINNRKTIVLEYRTKDGEISTGAFSLFKTTTQNYKELCKRNEYRLFEQRNINNLKTT